MCLYPREIQNKRYTPTKKNGGVIPRCPDKRLKTVPIPCGNCMECRKKKKNEWTVRLIEDIKNNKNAKFVTLTFNNENLIKHEKLVSKNIQGYERENAAVSIAVRRFLERWRSVTGKSVRHCLITELGHKGTERIHIHGFLWTDESEEFIKERWKNGFIHIGEYVNEKSVNYITKYINKIDKDHKYYKSKMYISNGIGRGYEETENARNNRYKGKKGKDTIQTYKTRTGNKVALPKYYREKIYTERQREQLWINLLDEKVKYVDGNKIDISENQEAYYKQRNEARIKNRKLGYGSNYKDDIIEHLENKDRNRLAWCRKNGKHPRKRMDPVLELYEKQQISVLKVTELEYDTKKIPWDINEPTKKFRKPTKAKRMDKIIEENKGTWKSLKEEKRKWKPWEEIINEKMNI